MKSILIFFLFVSTLSAGIGEVTALKGAVSLERKGFSQAIELGLELLRKDLITTKERSKVQVILNDDTVITIGPKSSYHFLEYVETKDPEVLMQLDHGFFKAVTGKIGKLSPHRFKIKTRAASIGVRGTQFMAHVDIDNEQIACIQGTIVVTTIDRAIVVPAGRMLVYQDDEWTMRSIDFQLFEPVTLAQEHDLNVLFKESDLIGVNGEEITQEQLMKQRVVPSEDHNMPFTTTLGIDLQETEPFLRDESISVPVTIASDLYEVSSHIDDATPPPSFHLLNEVSVPVVIPLTDVYEINSAYDNTTPPPAFTP